jgi:hypothetical protein
MWVHGKHEAIAALNKSKDKDLVPLKEAISNNQFF